MKTVLIFFKSPEKPLSRSVLDAAENAFFNGGFNVDGIEILSENDDLGFGRRLSELKNVCAVDNLVIVGGEQTKFDIKKIVCDEFDTVVTENENAKAFVEAVCGDADEKYYTLPINSTLIPNVNGVFQGYLIEDNGFTLAVLPGEKKQTKATCDKFLIPYFEKKYRIDTKKLTLKYMGDKSRLNGAIENAEDISDGAFSYAISEKNGDFTIDLRFSESELSESGNVIRSIVGELKDDIYAEYDVTLGERLFDLLKLKKLKIATAESFTGGRVVSSIISNPGASQVVSEGMVTYSNESKEYRLGVKKEDLFKNGAVSSIVAYQMAAGLLADGSCDIAIATTGIAGPKSDDSQKPVGLCYIAVGMRDGVHTYKYVFKGSREEITEKAKNTALFLAIKKLKRI